MKFFKNIFTSFLILSFLFSSTRIISAASTPENTKDIQWVNQVFEKGKAFYEKGDYKSAVREWDQLNPYLDQNPSFKKVIDFLKSRMNGAPAPAKASLTSGEMVQALEKPIKLSPPGSTRPRRSG